MKPFALVKAEILENILGGKKAKFLGECRLLMGGTHLLFTDLDFIERPEELQKMTTVFDMYEDRIALKEWARSEILKELVNLEEISPLVGY